jgi:nucleotide-binding universal stress UspA family protein
MSKTTIVAAVDFSAASITAVRWTAAHLARGADIIGVHAVDAPVPPAFLAPLLAPLEPLKEAAALGAQEQFRALAAELPRFSGEVRMQNATSAVLDVAAERHAALVVLGPHSVRPGLGRMLGSKAEHISRAAECPVMVVRGTTDRPIRRVLVATDESVSGVAALAWAAAQVAGTDRELVALHVVDPALTGAVSIGAAPRERREALQELRQAGERWVDGTLDESGVPRDRCAGSIRFGDPISEILAAVEAYDADLLVVGRGKPGITRTMGSVADAVLRNAKVSTVIVP